MSIGATYHMRHGLYLAGMTRPSQSSAHFTFPHSDLTFYQKKIRYSLYRSMHIYISQHMFQSLILHTREMFLCCSAQNL